MAASSLYLKQFPRLLTTSSRRPMAASSINLKHLPRLLHTSSLRPMTLQVTPSCFPTDAELTFYETLHVQREPEPTNEKPNLPFFVHHEFKVRCRLDGFDVRFFMVGVNKANVKVLIERDKLIAEGKMERDFDDVDDDTNVLIRYRMSRSPTEVFDLDATKAEIKNGILKVFVPKKDWDVFVPTEG